MPIINQKAPPPPQKEKEETLNTLNKVGIKAQFKLD